MKNTNVAGQQTSVCRPRPRAIAMLPIVILSFTVCVFAQTPQATPPPPAAPRTVQFPKPVERTLPNGLRVVVIQRSEMPLISAQLLIKSGGEVDPADLSGAADMTAALLTRGSKTRSATQIAEAIEALGGSINSGARWDSSAVGVDVMSTRIGPAMEIVADVVRNPAFKDEEIDRLRRQYLNNLKVSLIRSSTLRDARVSATDQTRRHRPVARHVLSAGQCHPGHRR